MAPPIENSQLGGIDSDRAAAARMKQVEDPQFGCDQMELELFFPFTRLPIEIRRQIWKLAVPRGRIMRLDIYFHTNEYEFPGRFSEVPTILHICHESREVGLEIFRLGFPSLTSLGREIYWRPEADTLLLVGDSVYKHFPIVLSKGAHEPLLMVQHLAVPLYRVPLWGFEGRWMAGGLPKLTALKSLSLVVGGSIKYSPNITLAECLDEPVSMYENLTPSIIEEQVKSCSVKSESFGLPKWCQPKLEFSVIVPRKLKCSGFCIPT